jgi:hypothetical protein
LKFIKEEEKKFIYKKKTILYLMAVSVLDCCPWKYMIRLRNYSYGVLLTINKAPQAQFTASINFQNDISKFN